MNFTWLLKLIYNLSKASGYLFISIGFSSFEEVKTWKRLWNFIFFFLSFGLSLVATSYDAYLPVAEVTKSKLMEIGINSIIRLTIMTTCYIKIGNVVLHKRFMEILTKLQRNHAKVSKFGSEIIHFESINFFPVKN